MFQYDVFPADTLYPNVCPSAGSRPHDTWNVVAFTVALPMGGVDLS